MNRWVDDMSLAALRELVRKHDLHCTDLRKLASLRGAVLKAGLPFEKAPARAAPVAPIRRQNIPARSMPLGASFVALDFETANFSRDSACAISVVRVEEGSIVKTFSTLIRPPSMEFQFTHIHGITARDVKNAPTYASLHDEILELMKGVDFIAAHNSSFDKSVMNALCARWRLAAPNLPWECTVKLARRKWSLFPTKLPDVCRHLGIALKHHDATSDATACARIVLAARS